MSWSKTANDLAQAIRDTHAAREASWNGRSYGLTHEEAATKAGVPKAYREPVVAALASGYSDFTDWAQKTLKT